jgi:hypothetical protein
MRETLLIAAIGAVLVPACDTVQDRPPTWRYIHAAIITPSCATASCHSKISSVAGRDMSTPESAYAVLTGRTCNAPRIPGEALPDHPENFLAVLRGDGIRSNGDVGLLMPPDQPLPPVEIELIERWYDAGAKCD